MSVSHITEVIRRSEQGVTRPFFCRASDHKLYWVKGASAGKRALCCEWIAGRLARELNLPIPNFRVLNVDRDLVEFSARDDIADLGHGQVFGSEHVENVQEITVRDIKRVPERLQLQILLFDWWIKNSDRTLGEKGGNPNLLWDVASENKIHMIDHNLAFDGDFQSASFLQSHIFSESRDAASSESLLDARSAMADIQPLAAKIWREVPEHWLFLDSEKSMPLDFTHESVETTLNRLQNDFEKEWMGQQ